VATAVTLRVEEKPQCQGDLRFLEPGDYPQEVLKSVGDGAPNIAVAKRGKLVLVGIGDRFDVIGENRRVVKFGIDFRFALRRAL
jgi:hypothetical protein